MASVNQPDDEQQNQPGAPVTTGGSGGASTSGGQGAGVATPQSNVMQNQAPQQNTGYTDVASYLNANPSGSQQLGNQVAGNLTAKYNDTKASIDQSAGSAQSAAKNGYVPENTDLIKQVAADPTAAAKDPSKASAYQAQLNDAYTGPTNWADQGTQQGKVNDATSYANLANTPGGLNVYTQQVEGQTGGNQSQGINQLDSLLLGGSPGAMGTVKSAADKFSTLNDYINSQNMAVGNAITQGQTGAQNASQDALNAFTGANGTLTNLNADVTNTTAQRLQAAQQQQAQLKADIGNLYGGKALDTSATSLGTYGGGSTPWLNTTNYNVGDLSPQDLAAMGLNQDQWNSLKGQMQLAGTTQGMSGHNFGAGSPTTQVDLSQYLSQQDPTAAITAGTVATPEQYAKMSAIQQLLGDKMPQGAAINPANAAQAGTAPANTNTFNYTNALGDATQTEQGARQAAQDEANAISGNADAQHNASKGGGFLGALKTAAGYINPIAYLTNSTIANKALKVVKNKGDINV